MSTFPTYRTLKLLVYKSVDDFWGAISASGAQIYYGVYKWELQLTQ